MCSNCRGEWDCLAEETYCCFYILGTQFVSSPLQECVFVCTHTDPRSGFVRSDRECPADIAAAGHAHWLLSDVAGSPLYHLKKLLYSYNNSLRGAFLLPSDNSGLAASG